MSWAREVALWLALGVILVVPVFVDGAYAVAVWVVFLVWAYRRFGWWRVTARLAFWFFVLVAVFGMALIWLGTIPFLLHDRKRQLEGWRRMEDFLVEQAGVICACNPVAVDGGVPQEDAEGTKGK